MFGEKNNIDAQLITSFKEGNKAAINKLVKRWHKTFCEKAYWIVKDRELAKDIAQDSWRTIILQLDSLRDSHRFSAWATQIVYSKAIDSIHQTNKQALNELNYAKETKGLANEPVEDEKIKQKLRQAILELPFKQQHTLKLFYLEGYSIQEISKLLNVSIGTIKSRLFNAREKLKHILKQ